MKKVKLIDIDDCPIEYSSLPPGEELSCGKCGSKLYNSDVLGKAILEAIDKNSSDEDLGDDYWNLLHMFFRDMDIDEISDEDFNRYQNTGYPDKYYIVSEGSYPEVSVYYFLKKAEKVYFYTDDSCDCLKLFKD